MNKLIFDQDTQKGYEVVPMDDVVPNIESVLAEAIRNGHYVASTTYYSPDAITEKLFASIVVDDELYYNVPITRHGMDMNLMQDCYQVNFEKNGDDIWDTVEGQPDNFMTYLRTNNIGEVYLIGNNYKGNILNTYIGLTRAKYNVVLVTDAVNNLTDFILDKFKEYGEKFKNLRFLTTKEVIGELSV